MAVNVFGTLKVTRRFPAAGLCAPRAPSSTNLSAGCDRFAAHDSRLLHFEGGPDSNMTQSLRTLLKSQGVTVHGVFLGPIDTDMNRGLEIPKAPAGPRQRKASSTV